jgi:hyperosmotically inducible periplasmic protein
MSFRLAACLCLIGVAACSHNNPEPATGSDALDPPTTSNSEPALTPAAGETDRSTTSASTTSASTATTTASGTTASGSNANGSNANGSNAPSAAPLTADTRRAAGSDGAPPAANPAVQPDNTKVNERDKNSAAPTPPDQKENESDLKITQHVRQAVMADGSLSFTAKNVKIITQNGKVTLRGPVKSTQERDAIEAAARKVAGVTQVDNQIEVKK